MRAIWKGSISFGLVNIPVALYSATQHEELKFRLLRSSDLSPVKYKRVAEVDGQEVPWDQIVKGYEYEKGQFVVLTEEDFERVDLESTHTVEITDFVPQADINPMFFNKPYYMEPDKAGAKAYSLLRDALQQSGKVGIAKVVIKTRQYLAAVKPVGHALLVELMHFADELVNPAGLNLPTDGNVSKGEMNMALALIEQMSEPWTPEKYHDEYKAAVLDLIQKKIESGGRTPKGKAKARPATNLIDLVDVLRQSLGETKKRAEKPAAAAAARTKRKKAA